MSTGKVALKICRVCRAHIKMVSHKLVAAPDKLALLSRTGGGSGDTARAAAGPISQIVG